MIHIRFSVFYKANPLCVIMPLRPIGVPLRLISVCGFCLLLFFVLRTRVISRVHWLGVWSKIEADRTCRIVHTPDSCIVWKKSRPLEFDAVIFTADCVLTYTYTRIISSYWVSQLIKMWKSNCYNLQLLSIRIYGAAKLNYTYLFVTHQANRRIKLDGGV